MVMSVNTNISSLNAQRNLATSQNKLATAIARLSSGMRINSAKDDAAGLAISTRFTTQINGLNQAASNASDGISLAQTTESALNEVTNNMQRIRTLAVQSANATNSDSDRAALDAEVQQRLSEITRISQQTTFNGRHVLDGTFGSAAFQIGANVGETISINLSQGTGAAQVGQAAVSNSGSVASLFAGASTAATASVASATGVAGFDYSGANTKSFTVDGTTVTLNQAYANQAAVVAAVDTALGASYTVATSGANGFSITTAATGAGSAITIGGTDAAFITSNVAGSDAVPGAAVSLTLATGDLTIDGTDMAGTYKNAQALVDGINAKGIAGVSAYYDSTSQTVGLNALDDLTVNGAKSGAGAGNLAFSGAGATPIAAGGSLAGSNVTTVSGAYQTISRIDAALSTISDIRSDLGAVQNRFESTIANLQTISQNLSASRSQILDADFAAETANMTSANILQQAGVSVLAQANATTQSVLKLLQ